MRKNWNIGCEEFYFPVPLGDHPVQLAFCLVMHVINTSLRATTIYCSGFSGTKGDPHSRSCYLILP